MNLARFTYYHPTAYRRLLVGCCVLMLASGLVSVAGQHRGDGHTSVFTSLALVVPGAQATSAAATGRLTQLPGGDGSVTAAQVAADQAVAPVGSVASLGRIMNDARFGDAQWGALNSLWTRESNWNPAARNRFSGACGIPQALPCSKIPDTSPAGQIAWGLSYIAARYGTPSGAWAHELRYGWY